MNKNWIQIPGIFMLGYDVREQQEVQQLVMQQFAHYDNYFTYVLSEDDMTYALRDILKNPEDIMQRQRMQAECSSIFMPPEYDYKVMMIYNATDAQTITLMRAVKKQYAMDIRKFLIFTKVTQKSACIRLSNLLQDVRSDHEYLLENPPSHE